MGGTDNLKTSIGHGWAQGPINAPTVLNSSLNVAQFWDGRAKDLKEQAGGPIANPGEMASNHQLATHVLQSIPGYVREFKLAQPMVNRLKRSISRTPTEGTTAPNRSGRCNITAATSRPPLLPPLMPRLPGEV